jgi:hypothetical protein
MGGHPMDGPPVNEVAVTTNRLFQKWYTLSRVRAFSVGRVRTYYHGLSRVVPQYREQYNRRLPPIYVKLISYRGGLFAPTSVTVLTVGGLPRDMDGSPVEIPSI